MFCFFALTCRFIATKMAGARGLSGAEPCFRLWLLAPLSVAAVVNLWGAAMREKALGILAQGSDTSVLHPEASWYGGWNDRHISLGMRVLVLTISTSCQAAVPDQ